MLEIITAFIGVFAITWLLAPLSSQIGLTDKPTQRKQHEGDIPLIGGLAMFASCSIAALFFVPPSSEMAFLLTACALLVMTGSFDDRFDIHYYIRLAIQFIVAIMLIWGANTQLTNLGNLFAYGDIKLYSLSIPITIIAIIGMINAFNMIDGIDGLSGGLALISCIGIYILIGNQISDGAENILLLMIGALSAYLILNLHIFPKWTTKIFMGDAGSMVIGFTITAFLIRYSQESKQLIYPSTCLWLVAIPLMDLVSTFIRRIRHKKNPLRPDRTHVHHIFIRAGFTKTAAMMLIVLTQAIFVSIGILLDKFSSQTISFVLFILSFLLYLLMLSRAFKLAKFLGKKRILKFSKN